MRKIFKHIRNHIYFLTKRVLLLVTVSILFLHGVVLKKPAAIAINPTGSYTLNSKTKKKNGDIYGYFGTVHVKSIGNSRIAMSFYVSRGAPSYNSGSFVDTLNYKDNKAVRVPEDDPFCKLIFVFTKNELIVDQQEGDKSTSCGFGYGVVAKGSYKKISSKVPLINDQMIGE